MKKCPKEGLRVCFTPTVGARQFYPGRPRPGECGSTVTVPVGGGKRPTCIPGPRGGLVFVKWDQSGHEGAFRLDLARESSGKSLAGAAARRKRRR